MSSSASIELRAKDIGANLGRRNGRSNIANAGPAWIVERCPWCMHAGLHVANEDKTLPVFAHVLSVDRAGNASLDDRCHPPPRPSLSVCGRVGRFVRWLGARAERPTLRGARAHILATLELRNLRHLADVVHRRARPLPSLVRALELASAEWPDGQIKRTEWPHRLVLEPGSCTGCLAPPERCGPKQWSQQKKCCPDCSHERELYDRTRRSDGPSSGR